MKNVVLKNYGFCLKNDILLNIKTSKEKGLEIKAETMGHNCTVKRKYKVLLDEYEGIWWEGHLCKSVMGGWCQHTSLNFPLKSRE